MWAQVLYGVDEEWAFKVDDVLRRRTTLAHRGLGTESVRAAIASRMAEGAATRALA